MLSRNAKRTNRILAIETSTELLGVSVVDDTGMHFETTIVQARIHSEMLLPLCIQALETAGLAPESIDCLAVSSGPGSFTGLRIGSATVQGFALALKKPVARVPTFEVYLRQCSAYENVGVVQGKARGQTVCALYTKVPSTSGGPCGLPGFWSLYGFEQIVPVAAKSYEDFCENLRKVDSGPVWMTGDAAADFCRVASDSGTCDVRLVDEYFRLPRPGIVGLIGLRMLREGDTVHPSLAIPEYYRRSQAEVVLAQKKARETSDEESFTGDNQQNDSQRS
ncbi:MAG TPA: tRNA (adenosine(37)-N6)-threonylcarbamoyltransferase complex dimerization subunit type 1 TsaB [Firmicutes bacterium]|jgi:tRNA threonylcarbamoyladenosine biosynthesis protein TsaB|nr:tRNA (adenosine(37)-N6)-threonylcarbamoyltransferase complex dimerization subunit type 1 TsaB [Bacillota bacterium]